MARVWTEVARVGLDVARTGLEVHWDPVSPRPEVESLNLDQARGGQSRAGQTNSPLSLSLSPRSPKQISHCTVSHVSALAAGFSI